ncbi:MAG: PaaI family thioesterase [Saprospiraceae bacterium]|uniref:PaaI family thioesterase n=1 Tax=Candidatus Opimibacter skivensis TaxID=2982028 RepID=A0A9D7SS89_9BACT|nr:PaaI family thioesterase [Candidatus Opimibacter skivensis]
MTDLENHYRKLERMYLQARVNAEIYTGIQLHVENERAELSLNISTKYHHAAKAMHGSVYFKMLDDAAFFAVNSIVTDVFVYTVSFNIQMLRPVAHGMIKSIGELKFKSNNLFIADSTLWDENNKLVGRGSGNFMKSKIALTEEIGYK